MKQMNVVAEFWSGVDTELGYADTRAKTLRDDDTLDEDTLQMKIMGLTRNWKGVEKDFKEYINAVRAIHA